MSKVYLKKQRFLRNWESFTKNIFNRFQILTQITQASRNHWTLTPTTSSCISGIPHRCITTLLQWIIFFLLPLCQSFYYMTSQIHNVVIVSTYCIHDIPISWWCSRAQNRCGATERNCVRRRKKNLKLWDIITQWIKTFVLCCVLNGNFVATREWSCSVFDAIFCEFCTMKGILYARLMIAASEAIQRIIPVVSARRSRKAKRYSPRGR